MNSRNLTYLLSQSQTHWWRPVAWGSWTRWRGVCVVSVAGGWPPWRASSERRAWGTVSHWPAVSWCLNNTGQEVLILCQDSFVKLFSSFPAFSNVNVINYVVKVSQTLPTKLSVSYSSDCSVTHFSKQDADLRVSPALSSSASSFSLISYCKVVVSK